MFHRQYFFTTNLCNRKKCLTEAISSHASWAANSDRDPKSHSGQEPERPVLPGPPHPSCCQLSVADLTPGHPLGRSPSHHPSTQWPLTCTGSFLQRDSVAPASATTDSTAGTLPSVAVTALVPGETTVPTPPAPRLSQEETTASDLPGALTSLSLLRDSKWLGSPGSDVTAHV